MGWFNKNGDKKKDSSRENSQTESKTSTPKKPHGKLHTRRKKKTLLGRMKLTQSVPATIIDALHGDSAILSSDKDFVHSPALKFSDGTWYPIFVMDEADLDAAGLGEKENRETLGQLSVGLKTSSGATGFVPVVTTDSLAQDYIGLLPMHDAFEVLRDFKPFMDYQAGWPVGLVNVDNDELRLRMTDLHLSMPQWWEFVNGRMDLVVNNDQLKLSMGANATSDPLAVSSQEAEGGAGVSNNGVAVHNLDTDDMLPTGEFDDDDGMASNSNISAFVNSQSPQSVNSVVSDTAPANGFAIPDIVEEDSSTVDSGATPVDQNIDSYDNADVNSMSTSTGVSEPISPLDLDNNGGNNQAVDTGSGIESQSVDANSVNTSANNVNSEPRVQYKESQSRDDLQAQNAIMSTSVRSLDDLQVSISDQEFVDSYLNQLEVQEIPMLDDSNDPTGRIHHLNMMRQQANMELQGSLAERKARLRQWFETARSSILEALRKGTQNSDSMIKAEREMLSRLNAKLADKDALIAQAKSNTIDQQQKLEADFNKDYTTAKQEALVQVDQTFNDRRRQLNLQKQALIDENVVDQQNDISRQINDAKTKIQQIAQDQAGKAYAKIMENGAAEFHRMQAQLENRRHSLLDKLDQDERAYRHEENRRAEHDAEIARTSTTITDLKQRIKKLEDEKKSAIEQVKSDANDKIQAVQRDADNAQSRAVAKVQDELDTEKNKNQDLEQKLADIRADFDKRDEKREADFKERLEAVRHESDDEVAKLVRSNKNFTRWMGVAIVGFGLFTGASSWFAGQMHGVNMMRSEISHSNNSNSQSSNNSERSQAPYIIQMPTSSNGSSSNNDSNSNSNKSSNSNSSASSQSSSQNNNDNK